MHDRYFIWWLDPPAVNAVFHVEYLRTMVGYVAHELSSLKGRDGRGRLWIHADIEDETEPVPLRVHWPEKATAISEWITLGSHGGIVIRREDIPAALPLPGFVTDFRLNKVWRPDE